MTMQREFVTSITVGFRLWREKSDTWLGAFSPERALRTKDEKIKHFKMIDTQIPDKKRSELRTLNVEREKIERGMRREIAAAATKSVNKSQTMIARLIESVGGKVNKKIAIINAVSAVVPTNSLSTLAAHPGVAELVYDAPGEPELNNQTSSLGVSGFWS
jgi:thioesterase domain-containing protein